jgi:hypothetical protein
MKIISTYLSFFVFLFLFQVTLSAEEGDAVYKKIIHEYTLNPDGSNEYREYKEIKLLSYLSFNRMYGETFIIFDPAYQELEINEAYTIMANGQRVDVPDNAFNEVLPRAASHAPAYNRLREMVVTHTGLEIGASIYLDYTLKTKAGFMPAFMGEEFIKDIVPIDERQVIIRIPADKELQYKVLNIRTAPEVSLDKGMNVYTFTFRGLSAYSGGWGTDYELLPRLFFSAAKDLERAYFPFVSQPAFTYPANPEMEMAVEKIKEEEKDDLQVALALQKLVSSDIATWNLSPKYTGFKCRTPVEVWNSNGGTKLEKTILLATLLQKARLSGVPIAIIPDKYYDRKVGSLYMIEDFAVQAKVGMGERLYLSATHSQDQNMSFSLAGNKLLVLDGAIESLRTFDEVPTTPEILYDGNFTIEDDHKLAGNIQIKLSHGLNPYFSLSLDTAYAKRYASGVQNVKLNALSMAHSEFELEIEKSGALKEYDGYMFLKLPDCNKGISSWGYSYIEANRSTPIKLPALIIEKYTYMITLPDNYTLVTPEVNIITDNEIGNIDISISSAGKTVFISREIILKKSHVNYDEFADFSELWEAWMNPHFQEIIIKK